MQICLTRAVVMPSRSAASVTVQIFVREIVDIAEVYGTENTCQDRPADREQAGHVDSVAEGLAG